MSVETCGGPGAQLRTPRLVVTAARRAFAVRSGPRAEAAALVFDSFDDASEHEEARRLLLFTAGHFDLLITIAVQPRGKVLGGAVWGPQPVSLAVRRPTRATIVIPASDDGVLTATIVPPGS